MEKKDIYQKLHEARKYIKTCGEEKKGWNDYSKYKYYTPDQISDLSFRACEDQHLLTKFSLIRDELGILGQLIIINLDNPDEKEIFSMASAIPEIKATNASQQLGGAVTYTERYLLMVAFDIKDNNLDFDSKDQSKKSESATKTEPTEWLNKWTNKAKTQERTEYWTIVNRANETNKTTNDLREFYKINKEVAKELETDLNN